MTHSAAQTFTYASLYRARGGGWELHLHNSVERGLQSGEIVKVAGKREARRLAQERGAQAWNF